MEFINLILMVLEDRVVGICLMFTNDNQVVLQKSTDSGSNYDNCISWWNNLW